MVFPLSTSFHLFLPLFTSFCFTSDIPRLSPSSKPKPKLKLNISLSLSGSLSLGLA